MGLVHIQIFLQLSIVGNGFFAMKELFPCFFLFALLSPFSCSIVSNTTTTTALEVIPYTLAENAGMNPISIVTELRSEHAKGKVGAGDQQLGAC